MNLLEILVSILSPIAKVQTAGYFSESDNQYIVLTPISESYDLYADNKPIINVEQVKINIFTKGNYNQLKTQVVNKVLDRGITIISRGFIEYEPDSKYYHYSIEVEKEFYIETED